MTVHHRLDVRAPAIDFAMDEALQEKVHTQGGREGIASQVEFDHVVGRHQFGR
jgi:hypothetical protein